MFTYANALNRIGTCLLTISLFCVFSKDGLGQTDELSDTVLHLKPIVLAYQANSLSPISFQNISGDALQARSVGQEPSFLLSETPSITQYSDGGFSQGYSYFRLRGIDQTRINITLDGVPLNEPEDQGAYFSNYPDILNSVSRIQIQRGIGSSKNGVASYGGSIELFSPNLFDSTQLSLGLGYGSYNSLRAYAKYHTGLKRDKAFYVRASQVYSEGYKYRSAHNSQSVFVSGGWLGEKNVWKLNVLAGQQRNELAWLGVSDSLIRLDRRTNANAEEDDRFSQALVQLQQHYAFSEYASLHSSLYYTFLKGNYDFDLNNFLGLPSTEELYNYAFLSNLWGFYSNYSINKSEFQFTAGVHGNLYDRRHTGSEERLGQLYQNTGYKQEGSVFVKMSYLLGTITLFTDLQYRYTRFDYEGAVAASPIDWDFINPKVGLSAKLSPNLVGYYSLGKTGREPTRNDLFGGNDDLLSDSLGNPLLFIQDPEFVVDHELGLRYRSVRFDAGVNVYFMDFEDEIVLNGQFGPNGLALTDNVGQSFRSGVELSLGYMPTHFLKFVHHASFNRSRIRENGVEFSPILTPAVILFQELQFSYKNFSAALSFRYQAASYLDFANTTELEDYGLVNMRLGYDVGRLHLMLYGNNLTNARFFNNGYIDFDGSPKYFVQAPTNFFMSLMYSL